MTIKATNISKLIDDFKKNNSVPFIIEVLGTPNSGKTTAIKTLDTVLKRCNVKYKIIYEVASKCKIRDKYSLDFNLWTLSETTKLLLDASKRKYDIIICERGFLDAICWCNLYFKDNKMTKEEFDAIKNYILLDRYVGLIDLVYVLKCSIDSSLQREQLDGLLDVRGSIVNEEVLEKYNNSLEETYQTYGSKFKKNIVLDTSDITQKDLNKTFVRSIFDIIQSETVKKSL